MHEIPGVLHRWRLSATALVLGGLLVAGTLLYVVLAVGGRPSPEPDAGETVEVAWAFEAQRRGAIVSAPLVTPTRIYVTALHDTAFHNAGAVYCLDRATGKRLWHFDAQEKMQHTFSSPCLADGRLYVGEGMHANFVCKLYCLDAETGASLWSFTAEGHIESSPCVADGKVFFGAGDDGLYCLDAATGKKCWQLRRPLHIDSSPAVVGKRLYAGSGVSRLNRTTEAFCLDTQTGEVVWRFPTTLPVWGSPAISGGDVYFGLGNGRLLAGPQPPEKPAGALLCLTAEGGQPRWRYDIDDGVFTRPAVGPEHVFFGARDGVCYCLDRQTGQLCWKEDLGSPVVASPFFLNGRLHVIASRGPVCCLDASSGRRIWTFDLAGYTRLEPRLISSPTVAADPERGHWVYFGAEVRNSVNSAAILYCLHVR